jgi:hypothetical protein
MITFTSKLKVLEAMLKEKDTEINKLKTSMGDNLDYIKTIEELKAENKKLSLELMNKIEEIEKLEQSQKTFNKEVEALASTKALEIIGNSGSRPLNQESNDNPISIKINKKDYKGYNVKEYIKSNRE